MSDYLPIWENIIDAADVRISDIKPSDWCEQNRYMTAEVSPIPGMFSYDNSPYTREIVDCLSPDNPARVVAVMKGAQIGFSTSVIEPGIGWIISQQPGNILFLVGHEDLVSDAVKKVDRMIDSTSIRKLIRSTSGRARNTKSGDTDKMKEFPEGYLKMGIANHKSLRNISMQYGFIDDFESMKGETKEAGSTAKMIEKRFSAYSKKKKIFYISTPELKETSNIEPEYLAGDQRKYHIECPCCNDYIPLEWSIKSEKDPKKTAGITWEYDDEGDLDPQSVGYICQKCDCFFDDSNKMEMLKNGKWIPTAKPKDPTRRSYHISSLYSPTYMDGWVKFVRDYIDANPEGQPRKESAWKTFLNTTLGETYSATVQGAKAEDLQRNIRDYEILTVPEKLSIEDGNGKIVMLTCGSDLNGKLDDARLDYEIVAHSESGATYSVIHGSIGTFINKDKNPERRAHSTYRFSEDNSVWDRFRGIISKVYETDTGRKIRVFMTGLDVGYMQDYALQFIDNYSETMIVGLKGNEYDNQNAVDKYNTLGIEKKSYQQSKNVKNMYLVESNYTKDVLSEKMKLKWDPKIDKRQPKGFMNFPTPSEGAYTLKSFFSHFESEEKIFDKNKYTWKKKPGTQNHLYDCRLYNEVAKEIFLDMFYREMKIKNGTWKDYVNAVT
jgi:phage terminase large subunit GpA-like protein